MPVLCRNCSKAANFGFPGSVRKYCGKHKLANMINLSKKYCIHPDCNKIAHYGESKAEYCLKHKTNESINFRSDLCLSLGCTTTAKFGYEDNRKKAIYCEKHKLSKYD
jgi:hypothetical protein